MDVIKFNPKFKRCKHHLIHLVRNVLVQVGEQNGFTIDSYYPNPIGSGLIHVVIIKEGVIVAGVNVKHSVNPTHVPLNLMGLEEFGVRMFTLNSFDKDDMDELVENILQVIK